MNRLTAAQEALEDIRATAAESILAARLARDVAIRAAVQDGMSMAEVGRITGLSRERVRQIVGGDSDGASET